jgi:hypothetical protein
LWAITKDELLRNLTDTEASNGFGNRFVWLAVRRSKELPFTSAPSDQAIAELAVRILAVLKHGRSLGRLEMSESARQGWQAVYHDLSADRHGLSGALMARAEAQVTRIAGIYAVLDGCECLDLIHLKAALALWEFAEASTIAIFGGALGDPIADTILRAVRASGELSDSRISDLFGRHMPAARLDRAKASLLRANLIHCETVETAGRPRVVWRPGEKKAN